MKQFEGVREAMLCFYEMFTAYNVGIFDRLLSQEHESIAIGTALEERSNHREQWRSAFEVFGV